MQDAPWVLFELNIHQTGYPTIAGSTMSAEIAKTVQPVVMQSPSTKSSKRNKEQQVYQYKNDQIDIYIHNNMS